MRIKTGNFLIGKRINIVIILTVLLLFVTIAIPSFCMLLMKDNSNEIEYWDGTIATSYNSGTGEEEDPYIISNAKEFAYFSQEINNGNNYSGKYFKLTDNIHLNNGVFEYKNNQIVYTRDSVKYYIKPFTDEYYQDSQFTKKIGKINIFPEMKIFQGNIDGNDKFIYGLYLTDDEDLTLSLFETHNNGQIKNLYFSNALIYGNYSVGLIHNTQNGTYNNIIFNGNIYSTGLDKVIPLNIDDIITNGNTNDINLTLDSYQLPEFSFETKISLKGISNGDNIYIDNNLINQGEFELEYDKVPDKISINSAATGNTLSNLVLGVYYNDSISSLINNINNSRINNTFVRGNVTGKYITSSLIGIVTNNLELNNTFNDANVTGKYMTTGLIGIVNSASINMGNTYNSGNINSEEYAGGIFGEILSSYNINLHDSFNTGTITSNTKGALVGKSDMNVINHNNYYTNQNITSIGNLQGDAGTYIDTTSLLTKTFLSTTLKFQNTTWNVADNELPKLITFDNEEPTVTINTNSYTWTNINKNKTKITETIWFDVEYEDKQSDILKVEYYIGNKIYTKEEINQLDFKLYDETISLEENGDYYIIFKTTDVVGNVNITTTDLITIDGYNLTISDIYNNSLKDYDNQISFDSSIKYNFKRSYSMESFVYPNETSYMLKTNIQLPNNTDIKLIDNINNQIYFYTVNNDDVAYINNNYMYNLSLFKELGKITDNYFDNKLINYYNNKILKENYDIIINFQNANVSDNENIEIDLITINENTIYSTTYTNLNKQFKLVKYDDNNQEVGYNLSVSTDYKEYIDMSTINSYNINLYNQITNSKLNDKEIYNEKVNNKKYILLKIFDANDKLVSGNLVNSIEIEYNESKYYSNNSGYIKIPFENNNIELKLNINYIINDVLNGLYYLKINTCNNVGICSREETIPIKVSNNISNIDCKFTVNINDKDRLISRSSGVNLNNRNYMNMIIDYDGELTNPNIRIKMYKKLNFDSNNQVYELIDLSQYTLNKLELIENYQYSLVKELKENTSIDLHLLTKNFEYGGYKLTFELYDGDSFVKEDNKTFIVK